MHGIEAWSVAIKSNRRKSSNGFIINYKAVFGYVLVPSLHIPYWFIYKKAFFYGGWPWSVFLRILYISSLYYTLPLPKSPYRALSISLSTTPRTKLFLPYSLYSTLSISFIIKKHSYKKGVVDFVIWTLSYNQYFLLHKYFLIYELMR